LQLQTQATLPNAQDEPKEITVEMEVEEPKSEYQETFEAARLENPDIKEPDDDFEILDKAEVISLEPKEDIKEIITPQSPVVKKRELSTEALEPRNPLLATEMQPNRGMAK